MSEQIREMLWAPSAERIANSKMARYQRWLAQTHGVHTTDYASLWRWSVDQRGPFWSSIWEYFDVLASQTTEVAVTDDAMPGTRWFPGARLNWAQNLLRPTGHHNPAIISVAENGTTGQLSRTELVAQVANLAAHLRQAGVRPGDRVAAVLPNIAPAVVAVLACASVGAVWSCCAPDFGLNGLVDRFGQIEPTVLIGVDGYSFAGKPVDRRALIDQLRSRLPSVRRTIIVRNLDPVNINILCCAASSQTALDPRHPIVGESSLSLVSRRQRATHNSSVRDTATRLSVTSVCRHTSTRPWNTAHDLV
jgi:acetoacetyl-CoA synthetase